MMKKTGEFLIVVSVALNLAFVTAWAVRALPAHAERIGGAGSREGVWCRLHRELEVTEEQWSQIEPRLLAFKESAQAASEDVGRARTELIDLIASPNPDTEAIRGKQEEVRKAQSRMQDLVVEHLLDEKKLLTEGQQQRLFQIMRERTGCFGRGPKLGGMAPRRGLPTRGSDAGEM